MTGIWQLSYNNRTRIRRRRKRWITAIFALCFIIKTKNEWAEESPLKTRNRRIFLKSALGNLANHYLTYSEDTFRKWFSGERSISGELWKVVTDNYNEATFVQALNDEINQHQLPQILSGMNYGIYNNDFDAAKQFISKLFYNIAFGNGEINNPCDTFKFEKKMLTASRPHQIFKKY